MNMQSSRRLTIKVGCVSLSGGGRKLTSRGVPRAMKKSAIVVIESQTRIAREVRGSINHRAQDRPVVAVVADRAPDMALYVEEAATGEGATGGFLAASFMQRSPGSAEAVALERCRLFIVEHLASIPLTLSVECLSRLAACTAAAAAAMKLWDPR